MTIKSLKNTDFNTIINCFKIAFDGYFVALPMEARFWKERWLRAKVNYNLSYGMFDNGKLVGFIINAIDIREGKLTAYNTGTGVLPEYRGKRIIKSIYKYALPDLSRNGVKRCTLEVIKENEIAIKSYQSIGFKICKIYKCYKGIINIKENPIVELVEIKENNVDWSQFPNQELYSWDNHKNVIKNGEYKYYQIMNNGIFESYFIINPSNGNIAQFDILKNDIASLERLFTGIKQISKTIKINNIDNQLSYKIDYLNKIGIENTIDQYEMEK